MHSRGNGPLKGDLDLINASAVCRAEDIGSFCRQRDSTRRDTREKSPFPYFSPVAAARKLSLRRERNLTLAMWQSSKRNTVETSDSETFDRKN